MRWRQRRAQADGADLAERAAVGQVAGSGLVDARAAFTDPDAGRLDVLEHRPSWWDVQPSTLPQYPGTLTRTLSGGARMSGSVGEFADGPAFTGGYTTIHGRAARIADPLLIVEPWWEAPVAGIREVPPSDAASIPDVCRGRP